MTHPIQRRDLFLLCHKPHITELIAQSRRELPLDLVNLIAEYVTGQEDCFGVKEFQRYFGVTPLNARELPFTTKFYQFWHGRDALTPTLQRCETHHLPFLRPERVQSVCKTLTYDFKTLYRLMKFPTPAGRATELRGAHEIPEDLIRAPEPLAWIVARKGVIARDKDYGEQRDKIENLRSDYEYRPAALDLATLCATEYVSSGRRCLGDVSGEEKQLTWSTAREMADRGWMQTHFLMVGNFTPDGFAVIATTEQEMPDRGIVALRKFKM